MRQPPATTGATGAALAAGLFGENAGPGRRRGDQTRREPHDHPADDRGEGGLS